MRLRSCVLCVLIFAATACTRTEPPAPVVEYGAGKGAGSVGIHTVLEGDTVYGVSRRYRLPMRDIIVLNALSPPYKLSLGYRMKLPPPNEYKVKSGDTLYSVARNFDVSVNQISRLNNIRPPYTIEKGQILRLPSPAEKKEKKSNSVAQQDNPSVTPGHKPAVQEASAARPAIPDNTPARSGNGKFLRPVEGRIISSYGPKKDGLHNDGINIQASRGAPVRAAENGTVVYTGDELKGYGNLVLIRHADGYMSAYGHLDRTLVKRGETIRRGQSIGTIGSSGQVDSPQLHFELRKGTKALDPEKYL